MYLATGLREYARYYAAYHKKPHHSLARINKFLAVSVEPGYAFKL